MVRHVQKAEKDEKERKITFTSKEVVHCPVCDGNFHREELFSGRVNAGELTDELHRTYIPMQAYGEVHPLIYDLTVCPSCWYAAFRSDFADIPAKVVRPLADGIEDRISAVGRIFPSPDFGSPRTLVEGAASYYLAIQCYEHYPKEYSPAVKQGISALRAAWLCGELEGKEPGQNYGYIARIFYNKARFLYRLALEQEQKGRENLTSVKWLGPDTDKNYGYEGVLYLHTMLELKYGPTADEARRLALLTEAKRTVAKMFGLGKKTKAKPGPLVDKVRDLYDRLKAELNEADDESDD